MANTLDFLVDAGELVTVRTLSHSAVQWASRAARANIASRRDDSHSNLGWSDRHAALTSHPLDESQRLQLGFSFSNGALIWLKDHAVVDALELADHGEATAEDWCNEHLSSADLNTTDQAEMPYQLNPVTYEELKGTESALQTLGAWFAHANSALEALVAVHGGNAATAPTVRCWPHHYDLATLFSLDDGDPETVRSVGIGVSPGDHFYAEPYLYCNPWPVPEGSLPAIDGPMQWHTDGFTSLVCPAHRMVEARNLSTLTDAAFSTVLTLLKY